MKKIYCKNCKYFNIKYGHFDDCQVPNKKYKMATLHNFYHDCKDYKRKWYTLLRLL
jgi:hypothetical protein